MVKDRYQNHAFSVTRCGTAQRSAVNIKESAPEFIRDRFGSPHLSVVRRLGLDVWFNNDRFGVPHLSGIGSPEPDATLGTLGASTFDLMFLRWSVNELTPFFAEEFPSESFSEDFFSSLSPEFSKEERWSWALFVCILSS